MAFLPNGYRSVSAARLEELDGLQISLVYYPRLFSGPAVISLPGTGLFLKMGECRKWRLGRGKREFTSGLA